MDTLAHALCEVEAKKPADTCKVKELELIDLLAYMLDTE